MRRFGTSDAYDFSNPALPIVVSTNNRVVITTRKVKCQYCGQWGEPHTKCDSCGGAVV